MYLSVCSFFEKYVLTEKCIRNAWKWSYITVIENCHSRTSHTWQYLIWVSKMAPEPQVKLLKVTKNLRKKAMHFKDTKSKKMTLYTLQIYSDFVFLYYIVYNQIKFSIISFQRIFWWISFHKKPFCHVWDILKQAGKFL